MIEDNRGVSLTLNYVLAISIATLLVAGLLVAGGSFVDRQQTAVVENELSVIGQRLVADIERADRMVAAGDADVTVQVDRSIPTAAVGNRYDVEIDPGSQPELVLVADGPDVSVSIPVSNRTPLAESSVNSGSVAIVYDESADELRLEDG